MTRLPIASLRPRPKGAPALRFVLLLLLSAVAANAVAQPAPSARIKLRFEILDGQEAALSQDDADLYFRGGATDEFDAYDATKLPPLSSSFGIVFFTGERQGQSINKAQDSRPLPLPAPIEASLGIQVTGLTGTGVLTWPTWTGVPEEWDVFLYDTVTETTVDLLLESSYTFPVTGNVPAGTAPRFRVQVVPASVTLSISGTSGADGQDAGWRMLAAPTPGATRANLADDVDFGVTSGNSLYTWSGSAWQASTSSTALTQGRGFLLYLFDDATDPIDPAMELDLPALASEVDLAATGLSTSNRWHLLGNPYPASFDLSALSLAANGFQSVVLVWDPSLDAYRPVVESSGTSDVLASWQGFFAERTAVGAGATSLTYDDAGMTTGGVLIGKTAVSDETASIGLRLSERRADGTTRVRDAAWLYFQDGAHDGWDAYDAGKAAPPSSALRPTLSFMSEREGQVIAKSQESRSFTSPGSVDMDLAVEPTGAETLEISWPEWENVPANWSVFLVDDVAGTRVDMRQAGSYAIAEGSGRYRIQIASPSTTDSEQGTSPARLALQPNLPNPFSHSTRLAFDLPEVAHVRLSVFDALGREVARPADAPFSSGRHEVIWSAEGLPSGVYLARLEVLDQVLVQRIMLVR